jgi:hypothetical protein
MDEFVVGREHAVRTAKARMIPKYIDLKNIDLKKIDLKNMDRTPKAR